MTNIQPSTIMGTNYNDISAFCNKSREPVFITKDGKNDLAVVSVEVYEALNDGRQELYRLLDEGRADVIAGRKSPREEVMRDIRRRIQDGAV
jgi:PHD/YefM family antitoxin component YafN of YafNO toxin-antitoxin module